MTDPLVSIITINSNNKPGLELTLKSVLAQTNVTFEYIIIDGGSTDGGLELINEYKKIVTQMLSEPDRGVYDAMNKGIQLAKGSYLIFLNSGDYFSQPNTLETCYSYMHNHPDHDIYYADINMFSREISTYSEKFTHPPSLTISYFKDNRPNHQASLIKKSLFDEFGLYPDHYKLAGDHWLFMKAFTCHKKFYFMNFCMIDYEIGGLSMTKGELYNAEVKMIYKTLTADWNNKSIKEPTPFLKSIFGFLSRKQDKLSN